MKRYGIILITVLAMTAVWASAHGEFYKYTTSEGVVAFTDDLAKVPENQREHSDQYEDSPTLDVPENESSTDAQALPEPPLPDDGLNSDDHPETEEAEYTEGLREDESSESSEELGEEMETDEETSEETSEETEAVSEEYAEPDDSLKSPEKSQVPTGQARQDANQLNQEKSLLDKEYLALQAEMETLEKTKPGLKSKDELQTYHEKIVNMNERISEYENRRKAYSDEVDVYNSGSSK